MEDFATARAGWVGLAALTSQPSGRPPTRAAGTQSYAAPRLSPLAAVFDITDIFTRILSTSRS